MSWHMTDGVIAVNDYAEDISYAMFVMSAGSALMAQVRAHDACVSSVARAFVRHHIEADASILTELVGHEWTDEGAS